MSASASASSSKVASTPILLCRYQLMAPRNPSGFSSLAPEILHMILTQASITTTDLLSFCHVSSALRPLAQEILWKDVSLGNLQAIKSWSRITIRRPELGARSRALHLTLPPFAEFTPADIKTISRALNKCINLDSLSLDRSPDASMNSNFIYVLLGRPFRLRCFTNRYCTIESLSPFFEQQQSIQTLNLQPTKETIPASLIPSVRSIIMPPTSIRTYFPDHDAHTTSTGITHVHVYLDGYYDVWWRWERRLFGQHITSLSIRTNGFWFPPNYSSLAISSLAQHLPALLQFRLIDQSGIEYIEDHREMPSISLQSQTLKVFAFICDAYHSGHDCIYDALRTEERRMEMARRIFSECQTLDVVVLGHNHRLLRSASDTITTISISEEDVDQLMAAKHPSDLRAIIV
ncbi:hypothetical protein HGRIS_005800 [Hohenbuehelia grisea]|uniref:F-box domain-containing protein n=1 Tax=Hohenbuehelia grisea TaxID=104357 RepID=A0ABR3K066_9AGAR